VLNRIYIVVGLLAIIVLAGAFIAPRFIQWSDYRDRMEELATGVLGADVTIRGDIAFSLLPTPRLEFSDVVVGDIESPAATVAGVEAEFALFDFLRDIYTVTALSLNEPRLELVLDESGLFSSGVEIAGGGTGVALRQARLVDGSVRLTDLRADAAYLASRIDGEFRLDSFTGPFQFQGFADYGDLRYDVRFGTSPADAEGIARLSASAREVSNGFSFAADGMLSAGMAPRFDGMLTYRQAPPASDDAEDIRGDLVLESPLTASTDRAVLSGFTLMPDANRAAMRLTGAVSIQLGARNSFDAVVSGGVFSLPPRDATEIASELPYEAVRLLSELPAPPLPPIPGRLGIDLAEASLRGFVLREIRVDAVTDGSAWTVEQAVANLPGETELRLSGRLSGDAGRPRFAGDLSVSAQRLDALSALWRRPVDNNPLFNQPGSLEGSVLLAGDALGLQGGRLTYAGQEHAVEMRLGFGAEPRLDAVAQLGTLSAPQTAGLLALVPDASETNFGISFPDGSLSFAADQIDLLGLPATGIDAQAQWSPQSLELSQLSISEWGGLDFDGTIRLGGTLSDPDITGSGQLGVSAPDAPALPALYDLAGVPAPWRERISPAFPAALQVALADDDEGQVLTLNGDLAPGPFDLRLELDGGIAALTTADLRLIASLEGEDPVAAQSLFGFGDAVSLFDGDAPMVASAFFEGSVPAGFEGRAALGQGDETMSYFGEVRLDSQGVASGEGTLETVLEGGRALSTLAGADGASLGAIDATAALRFRGLDEVELTGISAVIGDSGVAGEISMRATGGLPVWTGSLEADSIDAGGLAAALLGTEALLGVVEGPWPEGPLATSPTQRQSRGDIAISTGTMTALGQDILGATDFTFSWDQQAIALKSFEAEVGNGRLTLDLSQCCAGPLGDRTLMGRLSLSGVDVDAISPGPLAAGLSGTLDGGLQFDGTGGSLADAMRAMTGEGNFALTDFGATGLSSEVYPAISAIDNPLETGAEDLETLIGFGLSQGDFAAPVAQGAFAIAGGVARLGNLIIEGQGARLAGSVNLALASLGLDGSFVLTPRDYVDPTGLVEPDTARIVTTIGGTLAAPQIGIDLGEMVAAIQVRANELEVDRLETMRIEDEARQRQAAEERNRLIEEQQRRRAEEEAARIAAEAAAAAAAAAQPAPPPAVPPPAPPASSSFEYIPPPVNQPFGPLVNQPIEQFPN
jgi:hypothetical protein